MNTVERTATGDPSDPAVADVDEVVHPSRHHREGLVLLQAHPLFRRLLVVTQQLVCAAAIYTIALLVWKASGGSGRPGLAIVVAATAVVAVVLAKCSRAFERAVNWLAFGQRADAYGLAIGFLKRLSTSLEIDDVLPRLAETAARTVGSQEGEVRVWLADGTSWRQTWPLDATVGATAVTVPVRRSGDTVGEMAVSTPESDLSAADQRLLDELAGPAGLALSTVRLTHALRLQALEIEHTADQIRASRERIVDARRDEQARIREQLDTQVRPDLDVALRLLAGDGADDAGAEADAAAHVERALDELRHLSRGLFPARLAEAGLEVALRGWAEQAGRQVDVTVQGDTRRLEGHPDLTAAIYFCAVTALGQATCKSSVAITASDLDVDCVARLDEPPRAAVLQALSDRAEAFGGTAICGTSDADSGSGIVVRVHIPYVPDR